VTAGMCWINIRSTWLDPCLWSLYLLWALLVYAYAIAQILYTRLNFLSGMDAVIEQTQVATRKRVIASTLVSLYTYLTYMVFLVITLLVLGSLSSNGSARSPRLWIQHLLAFVFSARGYVDLIVWLMFEPVVGPRQHRPVNQTASSTRSSPFFWRKEKSLTAAELDLDLSPQLNPVLRRHIVYYVTTGIHDAVHCARSGHYFASGSAMGNASQSAAAAPARSSSASSLSFVNLSSIFRPSSRRREGVTEFFIHDRYRFRDYNAHDFQELREMAGIQDDAYMEQIRTMSFEKLSEGASGAFMFFSLNGRFIIKTVSRDEADTLHGMLAEYKRHLKLHRNSLLTRYYGSHSLHIYNQEFHFIVMHNIFRTNRAINARYDVKGSWVNRSAAPAIPGQRARCRHCRVPYVIGRGGPCRGRTEHEPDVVLKDNDLTEKIHLDPEHAFRLIRTLDEDSDFLCRQGIMDYSLLIGVHNIPFDVNPQITLQRRARRANSMKRKYSLPDGSSPSQDMASLCKTPAKMSSMDTRPHSNSSTAPPAADPAGYGASGVPYTPPSHRHPNTGLEDHGALRSPAPTEQRPASNSSVGVEVAALRSSQEEGGAAHSSTEMDPPEAAGLGDKAEQGHSGDEDDSEEALPVLPGSTVVDFEDFTGFMALEDHESAPMDPEELSKLVEPGGSVFQARVVIGPGFYFMGVIDTLQTWDFRKKAERALRVANLQDPNGISCLSPVPYARRFQQKVRQVIEHDFIRQVHS